jgi:hypothetical protein
MTVHIIETNASVCSVQLYRPDKFNCGQFLCFIVQWLAILVQPCKGVPAGNIRDYVTELFDGWKFDKLFGHDFFLV